MQSKLTRSVPFLIGLLVLALAITYVYHHAMRSTAEESRYALRPSPIENTRFYVDPNRPYARLADELETRGQKDDADRMRSVAVQPGSTWLVGPGTADDAAQRDIDAVQRTSLDASRQNTTPVYIVYAIPNRDACAGYSVGGFSNASDYLAWIDRIVDAVQGKAVFVIEPDAIPQAIRSDCLTSNEINERYELLRQSVHKLHASEKAKALYIDAGNSEWFSDPRALVPGLVASGIDITDGVSVNVSNFIDTDTSSRWAKKLVEQLPTGMGAVIDTSRNGRGAAPQQDSAEARWCNPPGRGIGPKPTTATGAEHIDAYVWAKNIGESDGACFGNLPAGTFDPKLALELARNASW